MKLENNPTLNFSNFHECKEKEKFLLSFLFILLYRCLENITVWSIEEKLSKVLNDKTHIWKKFP